MIIMKHYKKIFLKTLTIFGIIWSYVKWLTIRDFVRGLGLVKG